VTAGLPSPQPPQASVAFYSERAGDADLFSAVCELLLHAAATPTGVQVAPAKHAQAFERVGDLAAASSSADLGRAPVAAQRLRRLLAGEASKQRVLQVGFTMPPVGALLVTYEPAAHPKGRHPVAVVASAESLAPPGGTVGRRGRAVAHRLGELLRTGCDRLGPLYAAIVVEGSLPPPEGLSADARLGTELFVADRLLAADPGLGADLAALFEQGVVEPWLGGTYFSGWGLFNQAGRTIHAARTVERRAANRLLRAVTGAGLG
jgi:hypothetical protein